MTSPVCVHAKKATTTLLQSLASKWADPVDYGNSSDNSVKAVNKYIIKPTPCEVSSPTANQEIPRLLLTLKAQCHVHKSQPLIRI